MLYNLSPSSTGINNDIENIIKYDVTVGVSDINFVRGLARTGKLVKVHIELETGMNRTGVLSKYLESSDEQKKRQLKYLIEVDGGINKETSKLCVEAGCEVLVAGTYIYNNLSRKQLIEEMQKL